MSKSSGERFRRIINLWRQNKDDQTSQQSHVDPHPSKNQTAQSPPPTRPSTSTSRPDSEQPRQRASLAPERPAQASGKKAPPGKPRPQKSAPAEPFASSNDKASQPARPVPDVQWPGRAKRAAATPKAVPMPPLEPAPDMGELKTPTEARSFLEKLRAKTVKVVQDFAEGEINQRQFQAIYSHYQRQRRAIEEALIRMPGSGAWRAAAVEGHTIHLRQQHAAQVLSYAIYKTDSGIPLAQVGDFSVDPALLVPMLSSFRSITQELFGAGMKRTEIEGGRWLCFVPGRYTTLIVIFSAEPATLQLKMMEDLHRDFELVNKLTLSGEDVEQRALTFTHLWAFEQDPQS